MSIAPEPIDHREVDWDRVIRAGYLIRQTYRFEYPGPIGRLDHRLVIVPPERFGDQRRVLHRLTSVPHGDLEAGPDEFGNTVALNDDEDEAQGRLNSLVTFNTVSAGTYFIVATSYAPGQTGRYGVFIQD